MSFDPAGVLQTLVAHDVEFLVVGGVAAVLQGAPVVTQDLDVVYALDASNGVRLLAALETLDAVVRGDPRQLRLGPSHLATRGHKLLMTRLGALDLLGAIQLDLGYEELRGDAEWFELDGYRVRVLRLEKLIELKRVLGRAKDLAMVPVLEAALLERRR